MNNFAPSRPDDPKSLALISRVRGHVYGGTQLAVTVLLGVFGGYYLDKRFETFPWLLLAGSVVGVLGGLYGFLKPFLLKNDPPR